MGCACAQADPALENRRTGKARARACANMRARMRVRVRQNNRSRIAELSVWRAGLRRQEVNGGESVAEAESARARRVPNEMASADDEAETARRIKCGYDLKMLALDEHNA